MQTKDERRYWANRRKTERHYPAQPLPKRRGPVVLLAGTLREYAEMRRDHPDIEVHLDGSLLQQEQLFDTKELIDV